MFFLTYIKGTCINEWVIVVNQWLMCQLQGGILTNDKQLWNEVTTSFTRRFANNLENENTFLEHRLLLEALAVPHRSHLTSHPLV